MTQQVKSLICKAEAYGVHTRLLTNRIADLARKKTTASIEVVREHRKILNRLMQEQRVLKYSRVNAGAHLAEAQRLAAAYLQEGLDNPKS